MTATLTARREPVTRISVSLPGDVCRDLDRFVDEKGFESRSQAITAMITDTLIEHGRERGEGIMAGTITLFYNQRKNNLLAELADLKRRSIDEVIGSLQVQLENDHVMEVILVQGPVEKLQGITDELVTCKGVKAGKLTLTSTIIPQLHPLPRKR
ncbi:MAG: nickel-responsive transcriptional regulator NikR [Terrimicrobiaceae bacterium]|nr:nickel-responsive transcriptional regulator NikR [Terrimicrobiaceae bacterium]